MPDAAEPADPRLAALTEQALHLLEELADARLRAASLPAAEARCRELEERLAETRRHVRATRTARLAAPHSAAAERSEVDVYLWSPAAVRKEDRERWLLKLAPWLSTRTATLIVAQVERPTVETLAQLPTLRVLECDATNPAQVWNFGMAAGEAPLALFLACGGLPVAAAPSSAHAPALDESVALAQPVLTARGQASTLGFSEDAGLALQPTAAPPAASGVPEVDCAAPEAFYVSRASAARIGPFDEDVQGPLALHEYCLRARARGYLVIGLPGASVELPVPPGRGMDAPADRVMLVARHRPGRALHALLAEPSLWERSEGELRPFVRAVLQRLPNVPGELVGHLTDEILGLRAQLMPASAVAKLVQPVERALNDALGIAVAPRSGNSDAKTQLAQVLEKTRRLTARTEELERETELAKGRAAHAEREASAARGGAEAAQEEIARLAASSEQLTRELERSRASLRELFAASERAAEAATTQVARLQSEVAGLRDALAAETRHRAASERDAQEKLSAQARLLAERERWIALLLEELSRRGIKLRPRKLSAEEERFLAEHREKR